MKITTEDIMFLEKSTKYIEATTTPRLILDDGDRIKAKKRKFENKKIEDYSSSIFLFSKIFLYE